MEPVHAVGALLAVALPAVVVLRDLAAGPAPPGGTAAAEPEPAFADPAPELVVAPVLGVGVPPTAAPVELAAAVPAGALPEPEPVPDPKPVAEPEPEPEPEPVTPVAAERVREREPAVTYTSMLAGLSSTETEEHSALRRIGALVVLLALTLLVAAGIAALIYRVVSALG